MIWDINNSYFVYIVNIDSIKIMEEKEVNNFKKMLKDKFYEKYIVMKFTDMISEEEIKEGI